MNDATLTILDRICPDEAHLPPSARTWARIIRTPHHYDVLELRDPNSGQNSDPAAKPRHQYVVARERLWSRRLPPAPLASPEDETPCADDTGSSAWQLVAPSATLRGMFATRNPTWLPWEWAMAQGVLPYAIEPVQVKGEWQLTGDPDEVQTVGYIMPPADPTNIWADVTSYADCPPVRCPACDQPLCWYEAGHVPGYRVCMRDGDTSTIAHRWLWWDGVLVLLKSERV